MDEACDNVVQYNVRNVVAEALSNGHDSARIMSALLWEAASFACKVHGKEKAINALDLIRQAIEANVFKGCNDQTVPLSELVTAKCIEIEVQTAGGDGIEATLAPGDFAKIGQVGESLALRLLREAAKTVSHGDEIEPAVVAWAVCMLDRQTEFELWRLVHEAGGSARVVVTENNDDTFDVDTFEIRGTALQ